MPNAPCALNQSLCGKVLPESSASWSARLLSAGRLSVGRCGAPPEAQLHLAGVAPDWYRPLPHTLHFVVHVSARAQ